MIWVQDMDIDLISTSISIEHMAFPPAGPARAARAQVILREDGSVEWEEPRVSIL